MHSKLKNVPNLITSLRIVGTFALLFTTPFDKWFFIIYILTGLTDVFDGFIARKLHLTSEFGAKLDSIADLLFYSVMLIVLMPVLWEKLTLSLWIGVGVVLSFRLAAYITHAIRKGEFASSHSLFNKITGFLVFTIPFVMIIPYTVPVCWVICLISGFASLKEFIEYLH